MPSGAEFDDLPLSQMRKTIARRLTESIGPVPHFFLTINAMLERDGRKISLNDLIIRATAAALKRHPACNAHWLGDSIRRFNRVHIGVAPVAEAGQVVIRNRMKMTMSCHHRVIDGALGAAFLATLKGMLEEPSAILL